MMTLFVRGRRVNDVVNCNRAISLCSASEAKSPLYACAKLFLSTKSVNLDVLERIFSKAAQLKDAYAMRQVASVGIARSNDGSQRDQLKNLFLLALGGLTELRDAS
jgi:hypothetical protein